MQFFYESLPVLTCDLKTFTEQFASVAACCPSRTDREVLKNVQMFSAGDGFAMLLASNGEVHMRRTIEAKCDGMRTLLPSNRLLAILRELDSGTLELGASSGKISVKAGSAKFDLQVASADEFPEVPEFDDDQQIAVNSMELRNMLRRTLFATDADSTRYALGGVQFQFNGGSLTLASTDSRRLSVIECLCSKHGLTGFAPASVIPAAALKLLDKCLTSDGEVLVSVKSNTASFSFDGVSISCQLVQGRFPDYRRVVPEQSQIRGRVLIVAKSLASLVRQANITTDETSRGIDLTFTEKDLTASSGVKGIGQSRATMPISYQGPKLTMTFDGRYLGEFLKVAGDETVDVQLIASDDRALFVSGGWTHVIMPLSKD